MHTDRSHCSSMSRLTLDTSSSSSPCLNDEHEGGWVGSAQDRWCCVYGVQEAWPRGRAMLGNPSGAAPCRASQEETISHVSRQPETSEGSGIHRSWICVSGDGSNIQSDCSSHDAEKINPDHTADPASNRSPRAASNTASAVHTMYTPWKVSSPRPEPG